MKLYHIQSPLGLQGDRVGIVEAEPFRVLVDVGSADFAVKDLVERPVSHLAILVIAVIQNLHWIVVKELYKTDSHPMYPANCV
jgi:hypothetical protein